VIDSDGELLEFGTINLKRIKSFGAKLTKIAREIVMLVETHGITHIACETFFFHKGKNRGIVRIPELRGVLQHYADIYNLHWLDVHPTSMKKIMANNGRATKAAVIRAVRRHFELSKADYPEITDHEADAIGICYVAYVSK
jgi:Holliday junction resolvasome RuvABC endonuclease subunit